MRVVLIIIWGLSFMNLNGQDLQKHTWENRILIVKTSDIQSKKYQEQLKEFENSNEEMIDRKFLLYQVTGNDFVMIDYKNSKVNNSGKMSEKFINKIFNEKENFEVILIGLDGGIKLQQTQILTKKELYKIVDSMAMRSDELRSNRKKN